jgi:signal transduction histidine kinase
MEVFMEPPATPDAQAEQKLRDLADTQASLGRLAVLVVRGEPQEAVYAAVTREALRHFADGIVWVIRCELDGTMTILANEDTTGRGARGGGRGGVAPPARLTATVLNTGRPARVDDHRAIAGEEPALDEGLRSAVAMPIHVGARLWGMIVIGSDQGPLPPATEQRMTEFTDLLGAVIANAESRAELFASRARIVTASDAARRRLERELHDGALQHLIALALRLRSAPEGSEPGELRAEIEDIAGELMGVIDDLQELSRGIHPAILSMGGLRPALRALARRSAVPVEMDVRIHGRLPEPVEVAAYGVVSELLGNTARHACASVVALDADVSGGVLRLRVRDDGIGGADPVRGSGLIGLKDRIEALGGTFSVISPEGRGTEACCQLPVMTGGGHPDPGPGD